MTDTTSDTAQALHAAIRYELEQNHDRDGNANGVNLLEEDASVMADAVQAVLAKTPEPTPEQVEAEPQSQFPPLSVLRAEAIAEGVCTCDPGPEGQHRDWCALEYGAPSEDADKPKWVDAWPVGTYATIKVTDGASTAWPVVKRLAGGWQSGAHHYPDSTVESVRVLEVGGQQPGVPVEKVRAQQADFLKRAKWAKDHGEPEAAPIWDSAADLLQYLLPEEPTS